MVNAIVDDEEFTLVARHGRSNWRRAEEFLNTFLQAARAALAATDPPHFG